MKNRIHNDNINQVIDYSIKDDKLFIITEAQHGIPIFDWILQNKAIFTENMAALIMREILKAL